MKKKIYIPLALIAITPPVIISFTATSCSSSTIRHGMTDLTSYDSIIEPANAQTVTSNEQLKELGKEYLNDPKKVAADWTIAQAMDAEAILYHGRTGGIFSAPMNVYDGTTYKAQLPTPIQPSTAVNFFNGSDYSITGTTNFDNAVVDPNATNTHNVRQTTDNTGGTGPYIADNNHYGRFDTENHYILGGSRHWKLNTKVTYHTNNNDGQKHYDLYSHVVYDRPVYLFWAPVDNFTASSASDYDFHYHGYWAKEWIYDFKDVTFSETNKDGGTPYPYGISPTNGAYYNGLRNEVNWKYGTANSNQEANCVVKCFGSQWDGDEDFYGYGHYDPLQKFDVIPNLEKKENQWLYIERDHSPNISENPSPLNDGCWMSGSYYLDNLSIIIPQNKVI